MAWQPNLPVSSDKFSKSVNDLRGNFQAINSGWNVNHNDLTDARPGIHKWVTFPSQLAAPTLTVPQDIQMYNGVGPISSLQELIVQRDKGAGTISYPVTEAGESNVGYAYLPSGLVILWGQGQVDPGNPSQATAYGAGRPALAAAFWGSVVKNTDAQSYLFVDNVTATDIVVGHRLFDGSTPGFISVFRYIVIGLPS